MAISFPASPTVGQTYVYNSRTWTWNGSLWNKITTSLTTSMLVDGSITTVKIADLAVTSPKMSYAMSTSIAAGGGIKITSIVVTDSSYTDLDDTAVDTAGGYIKIIGTGFISGCQVVINQTLATSTTFVSSTEIRAQLPATTAGTYIVYAVNTDGSVGIRINGITFSATPTWTTSSSLPSSAVSSDVSIQLVATSATSYVLTSGSTLPAGLTLTSGGLLSGSVTGIASETTYSFSITATDAELQDSPRTFSITITVGDPYFSYTTLLLSGNGANNAQNNTFVDSSTNNFAITRIGTTTQGTFSPFALVGAYSAATKGGSMYFNGNYLSIPNNAVFSFGSSNFTIECWLYQTTGTVAWEGIISKWDAAGYASTNSYALGAGGSSGTMNFTCMSTSSTAVATGNVIPVLNIWNHVAVVKNGTTITLYVNGIAGPSPILNITSIYDGGAPLTIGTSVNGSYSVLNCYISNLRIVKGTALYTGTFTPPSAPLTAVANTSLLLSGTNAGIIDSTAKNLITTVGDAKISTTQSKFGGSSMYFDGTGDWLISLPSIVNTLGTGNLTVEFWVYPPVITGGYRTIVGDNVHPNGVGDWTIYQNNSAIEIWTAGGSSGVYNTLTASSVLLATTWTHIAWTKSSTTDKVFVNGVLAGTITDTNNYTGTQVIVGARWQSGTPAYPFTGYIDDLRITKGIARYTANFTPPVSQSQGQ